MTAVDSHEAKEGGMKFMVGEEGTEEEIREAIVELEEAGFSVLDVKSKNNNSWGSFVRLLGVEPL